MIDDCIDFGTSKDLSGSHSQVNDLFLSDKNLIMLYMSLFTVLLFQDKNS